MAISVPANAQQTTVAHGLSPLDVLVIKNEIRQRWADYTLILDGDGVNPLTGKWAEDSFTDDLRWLWFDREGKVQRNLSSMDEMRRRMHGLSANLQGASKHLPITIKFDDITPTQVRTRSVVMFLNVARAKVKGQPDGVPGLAAGVPQVGMAVYHDTWRKVNGTWKKSVSTLYSAQEGFWPGDPTP